MKIIFLSSSLVPLKLFCRDSNSSLVLFFSCLENMKTIPFFVQMLQALRLRWVCGDMTRNSHTVSPDATFFFLLLLGQKPVPVRRTWFTEKNIKFWGFLEFSLL